MTMSAKRLLIWVSTALLLGVGALYAAIVHSMLDDDPAMLLACMEVDAPWRGWTCEQVLRRAALTPDQVAELNRRGGALFPVMTKDARKAEDMLALFLARGVDVNAGDEEAEGLTALHAMAGEGNLQRVRLLLAYGARPGVRAAGGLTPLDFARMQLSRRPDDRGAAEVIRLLEAAERQPAQ